MTMENRSGGQPIRVLLVDDHTLFRHGIKSLLLRHKEFEVVGEAGDGLEGVKRAKQLAPDVVLLDLHMPGVGGREAVQLIREESPASQILMLTVSEDAEDLVATLQAGAQGYLLKNIDTDYLLDAIRRVAAGEAVITPQMTARLVHSVRAQATGAPAVAPPDKDKLSPREREILAQLAQGESNKEIARALDVTESTVKIHVQSILKKLNLSGRVQAAVYAVEHGLTKRDPT